MSSYSIKSLHDVFRSFKRRTSRMREGLELLQESASLSFSMRFEKGRNLECLFDETQSLVRFSALLRPFMSSHSPLELRSVWKILSETPGLVADERKETIESLFVASENLCISFELNGNPVTASALYFAYAEGAFFDEDPKARELLCQLSFGPMQQMVLFLFHSACVNYAKLTFAILDVILAIEKNHIEFMTTRSSDPQCIYCLKRSGDFGPEEHVIPEAFGVDELVIRDSVCQVCNNQLSILDQYLAEFEPLAWRRVFCVPLTKKGKFPRAEFRDFVLEKTKPRVIRITNKTKKDALTRDNLPDGSFKLSLNFNTRRPVDILRLARALFKIGLGLVSYDRGIEFACDKRFDPERRFIRGEGAMPNHLVISMIADPTLSIGTFWQSLESATPVGVEIFGVSFAFNLEPTPYGIRDEAPPDVFQSFWLGSEVKKGIVSACPRGCDHAENKMQK
jgi:hypothetical protein